MFPTDLAKMRKSISEINGETTAAYIQSQNPALDVKGWIREAVLCITKGDDAYKNNDLQLAYIKYMTAVVIIMEIIPKAKQFNMNDTSYQIQRSRIGKVVDKLELLKSQITTGNFNSTQKLPEANTTSRPSLDPRQSQSSFNQLNNSPPVPVKPKPDSLKMASITCSELHQLFVSNTKNILIFDIRPIEEYIKGHLACKNINISGGIINIDPSYLQAESLSVSLLSSYLSTINTQQINGMDHKKLFDNRNNADLIVFYDSDSRSDTFPYFSKLFRCIYLSEHGNCPKTPPKILTGGFKAWSYFISGSASFNYTDWIEIGSGNGISNTVSNIKYSSTNISAANEAIGKTTVKKYALPDNSNSEKTDFESRFASLMNKPTTKDVDTLAANKPVLKDVNLPSMNKSTSKDMDAPLMNKPTGKDKQEIVETEKHDSRSNEKSATRTRTLSSGTKIPNRTASLSKNSVRSDNVDTPSKRTSINIENFENPFYTFGAPSPRAAIMSSPAQNTIISTTEPILTRDGLKKPLIPLPDDASEYFQAMKKYPDLETIEVNYPRIARTASPALEEHDEAARFVAKYPSVETLNKTASPPPLPERRGPGSFNQNSFTPKPSNLENRIGSSHSMHNISNQGSQNNLYNKDIRPVAGSSFGSSNPPLYKPLPNPIGTNMQMQRPDMSFAPPMNPVPRPYVPTVPLLPLKSDPKSAQNSPPIPNLAQKPILNQIYNQPMLQPKPELSGPMLPPKPEPKPMRPIQPTGPIMPPKSTLSYNPSQPPLIPRKPITYDIPKRKSTIHERPPIERAFGLSGLRNLGNTCFMNSTIQCLSATIPLARYFLNGSYRRHISRNNPLGSQGKVADSYASLIQSLWSCEESVVIPTDFKACVGSMHPSFAGNEQQDSQEFLAFILDQLHEDLNIAKRPFPPNGPDLDSENYDPREFVQIETRRYLTRNWSIIVDMFQGILKSMLKCLTCGKTSTTYNHFMYLTLPIPPRNRNGAKNGPVTLQKCIEMFLEQEMLDGDDAWNCPRCKKPRKASKRLSIVKLPTVLLIHLKRFSFNGPFRDKLETFVDFPIDTANLTPYVEQMNGLQQYNYNLYAISNHFGGLNGGHYTAFVKNSIHNKWYNMDDSRTSGASENEIKSKAAYILYYARDTPDMKDWWRGTPEL